MGSVLDTNAHLSMYVNVAMDHTAKTHVVADQQCNQAHPSIRNPSTNFNASAGSSVIGHSQSVCTPVKIEKLSFWLKGYDESEKQFLENGFTNGFRIPYTGKRQFRTSVNLKSAQINPGVLISKIACEVAAGRVAGPFIDPPFLNLQVSPLGLVPKKEEGQYRVIHHLSFPEKSSVNDGIPDNYCTVSYQNIDTAVSLVKACGQFSYMMKVDIKNAYRIVPIHPDDFELLGFQIQ
jgi:hypothetical protein